MKSCETLRDVFVLLPFFDLQRDGDVTACMVRSRAARPLALGLLIPGWRRVAQPRVATLASLAASLRAAVRPIAARKDGVANNTRLEREE